MPTKKQITKSKVRSNARKFVRHLHRRIVFQLSVFSLISIIVFAVVLYDVFTSSLNIGWVLLGAAIGVLIGSIVGRAFALRWHEDSQQVIMSVDRMGIIIIVGYVALRLASKQLSGDFFSGLELIAVTYSLLGGIMIGRVFSMWRRIRVLLRAQDII